MTHILSLMNRLWISIIFFCVSFNQVYGGTLPKTMGLTAEGLRFTIASNFMSSIDTKSLYFQQAQVKTTDKGLDSQQRTFAQ